MNVTRIVNSVLLEDSSGRVLSATLGRAGGVMFTIPTGKPGRVQRVVEVDREALRTYARELLTLVGEHDQ